MSTVEGSVNYIELSMLVSVAGLSGRWLHCNSTLLITCEYASSSTNNLLVNINWIGHDLRMISLKQ